MGILINKNTKVVVQGITGREGSVRTKYMKSYGTHVVGGTSPGKKGSDVHGVPVYNTVKEIAREHGEIDFSVIFVPGHVLKTAVMEAADAGVKNVIPCVEGKYSDGRMTFISEEEMEAATCALLPELAKQAGLL